jgi:hypothetical protein
MVADPVAEAKTWIDGFSELCTEVHKIEVH